MRRLSSIIALIVLCSISFAQSPHGKDFSTNCGDCHTTEGWKIDRKSLAFNHDTIGFPLVGQHKILDCRQCHKTLLFSNTKKECMSCHTDIHYQTVGFECERCHTPKSWIVENITEIHQLSRFPLVGPHVTADCYSCHPSESLLRFEPLGVECFDCHKDNYYATTQPNHVEGNYSTTCEECHLMTSFDWTGASFNHSIFPLTGGHANVDCNACHTTGVYSKIPAECVSCHQPDYNATTDPNHSALGFPTDCNNCHDLTPGWKPASYGDHDAQFFPIYSGAHNGTWNTCTECHPNPDDYSVFRCTNCHQQGDMDDEHDEIGGYIYNDQACLECHPTGSGEGSFNHQTSIFPLTGSHLTAECSACHATGFAGTPTICFACHETEFNQSVNPNHTTIGIATECETCHTTDPDWTPALYPNHNETYPLLGAHATNVTCFACHEGNYVNTPNLCYGCHSDNYNQTTNPNHSAAQFSTGCETCHTTDPGWQPASFPIHDQYWPLTGAHTTLDCYNCHAGNYNSTPNTCYGCHQDDYEGTTDPNHAAAGFPTDCEMCHTTSVWVPSTFDHDGLYFPIYSGKHAGEWNTCSECHPNPSDFGTFTCTTSCHPQGETDGDHQEVGGYSYDSDACYACHPTGDSGGKLMRQKFNPN